MYGLSVLPKGATSQYRIASKWNLRRLAYKSGTLPLCHDARQQRQIIVIIIIIIIIMRKFIIIITTTTTIIIILISCTLDKAIQVYSLIFLRQR